MKKTLLVLVILLGTFFASSAQTEVNGCFTIDYVPLTPQNCTWNISVKARLQNSAGTMFTWSETSTGILNNSNTTFTGCLDKGLFSGYSFVPGAYVIDISNGTVSFSVNYATNPSQGTVEVPNNCVVRYNCNTRFYHNTTNKFKLVPGCVGGID